MRKDKLKGEGRNYELEIGATGNKPRGVVQEVRTLEILLNGSLEHVGDRADVGG
jgi:hypothetical protein